MRALGTGSLLATLCVLLATVGCGKPPKDKEPEKKKPLEESKRLYTGAGNATIRDPKDDRPIRYVINWEGSQLDYTLESGASGGALQKVSGDLYSKGVPGSEFTADRAVVDRAKNLLVLEGNVVVNGIDPKARLECQRLEWKTDTKLLKVKNGVTITFEQGVVGPMDELWCLPDLKQVGTPGSLQP